MSYSFTDSAEEDILQRTVMVPFVDLLNHSSQHHVELTFGRTALRLMVVRDIKKVDAHSRGAVIIVCHCRGKRS